MVVETIKYAKTKISNLQVLEKTNSKKKEEENDYQLN